MATYAPVPVAPSSPEVHEYTRTSKPVLSVRVAVMGSTNGTDLQAIFEALSSGRLTGIDIPLVISDKKDSGILARTRSSRYNAVFLDPKGLTRVEYDNQVSALFEREAIDLILLIGYMRLMSPAFVRKWHNKVMNIHPSLLPAFAGGMDLNVHEAVLERGCRVSGASLIFIDEGADTGPIISQEVVPVVYGPGGDTPASLKTKVQAAEGRLLIQALEWWRDGKIYMKGTTVFVDL